MSSLSKSGSSVMALAASGLLWNGAVDARPSTFLDPSGGLGGLDEGADLLSSSAGTAEPERVPDRLPTAICETSGAGEEAREVGLRLRLLEGTVRELPSADVLTVLRPRDCVESPRLIATLVSGTVDEDG